MHRACEIHLYNDNECHKDPLTDIKPLSSKISAYQKSHQNTNIDYPYITFYLAKALPFLQNKDTRQETLKLYAEANEKKGSGGFGLAYLP